MNQSFVNHKLKELNGKLLKKQYSELWTEDNPTLGYCYIVSEAIYHYFKGEIKAFCINMGELGTHWYTTIDDEVVDYTGEQFGEPLNYSKGVCKGFFKGSYKTDKGYISKRGYEMAKHLELI